MAEVNTQWISRSPQKLGDSLMNMEKRFGYLHPSGDMAHTSGHEQMSVALVQAMSE